MNGRRRTVSYRRGVRGMTLIEVLVALLVFSVGLIGMVWSAAKVLLRNDYHGWDNFVAWVRLDARCLDTAEWGGARLASLPLRSSYRAEASGHAD